MLVGNHGGLGDSWVDHDDGRGLVLQHTRGEERMVVGDVCAEQHDAVGVLQILIGTRRTVGAKCHFVAADRTGHAQCGVAVVVSKTKSESRKFAEGIKLFGHQLARGNNGH
jgi:hypothetical protein